MEEFSVGLALEDYVTVVFFAVGLYYLWRMSAKIDSGASKMVGLGGLLITLGGGIKATWKLIVAASGSNISWMDNSQFILMTPGYIILAGGMIAVLRSYSKIPAGSRNPWQIPMIASLATLAVAGFVGFSVEGRAWFFILLGMTTIMNVILSANLVRFSLKEKERLAAGLFVLNIVLVFTLAGMAGALGRDLAAQWIEQITNNISFGSFAIAAWIMNKKIATVIR